MSDDGRNDEPDVNEGRTRARPSPSSASAACTPAYATWSRGPPLGPDAATSGPGAVSPWLRLNARRARGYPLARRAFTSLRPCDAAPSLHGDGLGQVARLVDVEPALG